MKFVIPNFVRILAKVSYEVLFTDDFRDGQTDGECRPEPKQIIIKNTLSRTKKIKTWIHECVHAINFEEEIGLTESQVLKLEEGIYRVLRLNGWLK